MQKLLSKPRVWLPVVLLAAALTLALVLLFTVRGSAVEPTAEMQNFGYQTLTGLDLLKDDNTDLRFVFTIGNLDYEEVGFIVSKSVETPTYGAANCFTYTTSTAYRAITADSTSETAPDGRWWVAVKLTGIPHEYFDGSLYLRAFVKNADQDPVYSDPSLLTVCSAGGHTHVQAWNAEGTATLLSAGNLTGVCPGCGLSVNFTGVTRTPVFFDSKHQNTRGAEGALLAPQAQNKAIRNRTFLLSKSVGDIRGEDHFYPASTKTGAQGKDLWFEYSFLFSESFWNYNVFGKEMKLFSFRKENGGNPADDTYTDFYYLYSADNVTNDCPFKGHIDFSTYYPGSTPGQNCADDLGGVDTLNGKPIGRYIAGWGAGRDDSPYLYDSEWQNSYGWHRLGFRYHQEVASVSGSVVTYSAYTELYIDGLLCWRVHSNVDTLKNKGLLLWTATAAGGSITGYEDNDAVLAQMYLGNVMDSSTAVTVGVGDVFWTCGNGFVQNVTRVDNPNTGNERTDFFYTDDSLSLPISVMSYNIEGYGHGGDGWDGRDPSKAMQTVMDVSPDVVGFQEADTNWSSYFSALTSNGYSRLQGDSTTDKGEWVDIFYKTAKFTKISEGTYTYKSVASSLGVPNTESADQSKDTHGRIFHYAVLEEKSSGKKILVVNTHLHYGGTGSGHEEDDKLRRYEIKTMLAWLETQRETYPNQIVMGDMNSHYKTGQGNVNMALFTDGGFGLTCTDATLKGDVGGTLANDRTSRPQWIFDYILTRGNLGAAIYTVVDNPIDTDGKYPSDHVPILSKIFFR